jgi:hypothetical protein
MIHFVVLLDIQVEIMAQDTDNMGFIEGGKAD